MKKTAVIALTFVLIACLFTGCRRNVTPETSAPTTEPTKPATQPTTVATTPTTAPTTAPTTPAGTSGNNGSDGMMGDGTIDGTGDAGRGGRSSRAH